MFGESRTERETDTRTLTSLALYFDELSDNSLLFLPYLHFLDLAHIFTTIPFLLNPYKSPTNCQPPCSYFWL